MRRVLIIGSLGIVALVVAGIVYLTFSLDAIVARAIEREGTRVAGAPVRVGSVEIRLSEGSGSIRSLRVDNPEGFEDGQALELEEITLALEPASLRNPPIRLARIEVGRTTVNLEVDEQGRSNLDRILRHAEQSSDAPPEPASDGESAEPTRIAIDRLSFAGGVVRLDVAGEEEPEQVELPGFERKGVGGSQGATGGEIANVVASALVRQVAATTAGAQARRAVEKELGGAAGEAAGSLVRGLLGE